ncbi:MAG TPA: adenine phosphoribosyltransferase [Phycisphaerales bacterium]|nr:adenine phosphoribosyltransferase [Phycisphaerales bacterium]
MKTQLHGLIRDVADFPKKGILYKDITPLLGDAAGLSLAIELMANPFRKLGIDKVVAAESRGFIFGIAIARALNAGFVPVRKPGKLPAKKVSKSYDLEYGVDTLELHEDALSHGQRVLMVDDLLATGGTMRACCDLVEGLGGNIVGVTFLIELKALSGRKKLGGYVVESVLEY